jgi:hypothetical protein
MALQSARWWRAVRSGLARVGGHAFVSLAMIGIIAWTFVGSLLMGLTTPQSSEPRMVRLWLSGLAFIVAVAGACAWLAAGHQGSERDDA